MSSEFTEFQNEFELNRPRPVSEPTGRAEPQGDLYLTNGPRPAATVNSTPPQYTTHRRSQPVVHTPMVAAPFLKIIFQMAPASGIDSVAAICSHFWSSAFRSVATPA